MEHIEHMEAKRMLRGYKEIACAIESVWGVSIGLSSIWKWSKGNDDPLPIRRIRTGATRSTLTADSEQVKLWAQRKIS